MFPIPDALAGFYLICFAVGFLFVLVSLFLGITHDTLHLPGFGGNGGGTDGGGLDHGAVADVGTDAGGAGDTGLPGSVGDGGAPAHVSPHHGHGHGVSPINVSTVMAFLTWFGGAGYILRVYFGFLGVVSVVAASLAGVLGGALIFYLLVRVLIPGQRILNPNDYRIEGTVARVTVPIGPNGTGEIVYTKGGSRHSEGAKSVDGSAIERGTEVVVVRYEHGIAYVEPWSSYVRKG